MPPSAFVLLSAAWTSWSLPFFLIRGGGGKAQTVDRRARWGIVLEGIGFALVWMGPFWMRSPSSLRIAGASLFYALASTLSWTSARTLGKQWRFDAGLNADHQLVRSGGRLQDFGLQTSGFRLRSYLESSMWLMSKVCDFTEVRSPKSEAWSPKSGV